MEFVITQEFIAGFNSLPGLFPYPVAFRDGFCPRQPPQKISYGAPVAYSRRDQLFRPRFTEISNQN
jgi:hypothetical protein